MPHVSIKEIAQIFLKLGFIGFGGPAAHIAMMKQEVVEKRQWLSEAQFLDMVGATSLIPGPNSTEMAIHLGFEKRGWKGLLVAGLCFILPAVGITFVIAVLYQKYGHLPNVAPFIYGIKPAIIAIIITAILPLAKKSLKNLFQYFLGILVLVGSYLGLHEFLLLFGAGAIGFIAGMIKNDRLASVWPFPVLLSSSIALPSTKLFFTFLKIGAILYGSGYVLFAFLDEELVKTGYMSRAVLMDAIAVGQFTPGPVFSSVTFVGYQLNGTVGAVLATIGIFLPSFVFVALLKSLMKWLRKSPLFAGFLDAVNTASIAIILAVAFTMGKETILDWRTVFIAVLSLVIALRFKKINSAFIVVMGSLLGFFLSQI